MRCWSRLAVIRSAGVAVVAFALVLAGCSSDSPARSADVSVGITGGDFHSLVADPVTAGRLYVGGHTSVARSDDGGATWAPVDALSGADAMGWSIQSDAIWVSGHPGLNVSFDGGATFERHDAGLPDSDVHAFGSDGTTLYAAGPGIGVASSTDAGVTWTVVPSAAGQAFFGRILVDPADPAHLVAADVQNGAVASVDGGRTWSVLGTEPVAWVSSTDGLVTIYASGGPIPVRSRDGGGTWESVKVPAGVSLVEVGPDGTLYAGVHDGTAVAVWSSTDEGQTWSRA